MVGRGIGRAALKPKYPLEMWPRPQPPPQEGSRALAPHEHLGATLGAQGEEVWLAQECGCGWEPVPAQAVGQEGWGPAPRDPSHSPRPATTAQPGCSSARYRGAPEPEATGRPPPYTAATETRASQPGRAPHAAWSSPLQTLARAKPYAVAVTCSADSEFQPCSFPDSPPRALVSPVKWGWGQHPPRRAPVGFRQIRSPPGWH